MKKKFPLCPVCGEEYTERSGNRFRHFDRHGGGVTWHKWTLRDELRHRIKCVREAGGSVQDGSAKDGYYDVRSLEVVCDVARDRAKELDCIEREFAENPKTHMIHRDKDAIELREERRELLALVQEARQVMDEVCRRNTK